MDLQKEVEGICRKLDGEIGVAIKDKSSGQSVQVNADREFITASVYKIFVAVELFCQIEKGFCSLDDQFYLKAEQRITGSGILKYFHSGVGVSLRDLLHLMMILSDNTATDIITDVVGLGNVNSTIKGLGLHRTKVRLKVRELLARTVGLWPVELSLATFVESERRLANEEHDESFYTNLSDNNVSSPSDTLRVLEMILDNEILTRGHCDELLSIMKRQVYRYMIPELLPPTIEVAGKIGALPGVRADSGIIFAPKSPILISIYTMGVKDELERGLWKTTGNGVKAIQHITKLAFDYFTERPA